MSIIPPLRVTQLQMELRRNWRREQALIVALAVFEQQLARHGRKERTVWVKPWLLRRVTLGYYDTLMQELMRESRGDFKAFPKNIKAPRLSAWLASWFASVPTPCDFRKVIMRASFDLYEVVVKITR